VWIETLFDRETPDENMVTPHAGVWIETPSAVSIVAPAAGHAPRGRVD